jgi:hypothetical protein
VAFIVMAMSDITETIDTYIAAWNETDPARRAELVQRAWTPGGAYRDPMLEADGAEAIDGMIAAVHEQFPGQRFRRVTGIDTHHGFCRFGWELGEPEGAVTISGIDVGDLAADGRLVRVVGFFGDPPD